MSSPQPSFPAAPAPYGSELERRAAEVRARRSQEKAEREQFLAQQKAESALRLILAQPCPEHGAPPGKPCWRLPSDSKGQPSHKADRCEVDPPIQVEVATWARAGQPDWWVKEHRPRVEWWGRVRGTDGRQRWIKASDLRPADGERSDPTPTSRLTTLHVHPAQGDDTSSGAADGPLRTLVVDGLRPVKKPA